MMDKKIPNSATLSRGGDVVYTVAACRMDRIRSFVEKMDSKSRRLGLPPVEILDERTFFAPLPGHDFAWGRYTEFRIEGERPVVPGYKFLATMHHAPTGNIFRAVPGEVVPESFRKYPKFCDHCGLERDRKDTYLVREESSGQVFQVGSSCLKDFIGDNVTPQTYSAYFQLLADIEAALAQEPFEEARGGGPAQEEMAVSVEFVLSKAAAISRVFGWVSNKSARENDTTSTSSRFFDHLFPARGFEFSRSFVRNLEEDEELSAEALEWARGPQHSTSGSEYIRNLHFALLAPAVRISDIPLAVSSIAAYKKEKSKSEDSPKPLSKPLGSPGKREVFRGLTLFRKRGFENDGGGWTHIYNFTDSGGNSLVWFTSSIDLEEGKSYDVRGTVKDHRESKFGGGMETILSRCVLTPLKGASCTSS